MKKGVVSIVNNELQNSQFGLIKCRLAWLGLDGTV